MESCYLVRIGAPRAGGAVHASWTGQPRRPPEFAAVSSRGRRHDRRYARFLMAASNQKKAIVIFYRSIALRFFTRISKHELAASMLSIEKI
jgi:hypothetical protein